MVFVSSIPSSTKINRKKNKNVVKDGPPPTKLSGSAHEFAVAHTNYAHPANSVDMTAGQAEK